MRQTRLQLRTSVINNTQRADKADFINQALNDALSEMANRHQWRGLRVQSSVSVNVNDTSFPIPDNMNHIVSVRVQNENSILVHNLRLESKKQLEQRYPALGTLNTASTPCYAYEEAGIINFLPRASQNCTMVVTGDYNPGNLLSDTDQPSIPQAEPAIIAWATAETFRSIQMLEEAQYWDAQFEKRFLILKRNDQSRPAERRFVKPFPQPPGEYILEPWKDPFAGQRGLDVP